MKIFQKIRMYHRDIGLRGLLTWLLAKSTGSTFLLKIRRKDCRHPLLIRLPSSDFPTYRQVFLYQEYDFSITRPPRVIIDAGANIGLASVFFANRYPDATIIAIEPEQSNYSILKRNVAPYANIIPLQAALWNRNEEINLMSGKGNWGFTTESGKPDNSTDSRLCHTVPAFTVDEIMSRHQLEGIDILKIDIEGAEKEVFSDTSKWIDKVDSIIIELHERMKKGCDESFHGGSPGFAMKWTQGENVYLSKGNCIVK